MSKNSEGWVRHRGGKCPVEAGVEVSTRHRDGKIVEVHHMTAYADASAASLKCVWSHRNDDDDIMAYRLHKPAEQVEACSKPELRISLPENYGEIIGGSVEGPIQWRDRITELDFLKGGIDDAYQSRCADIAEERAELVQKLASEGFALIGRVVEPVEDYGNIQIGDLVSVISIGGFSDCTGLSVGDIVEVTSVDNDESLKTVSGGSWGSIGYNYKFHSRPSA